MAHFYGSMTGNRGTANRCGTKNSGLDAHIRGWDIGIRVNLRHINGKDVVTVYKTGGSNNPVDQKSLGEFTFIDLDKKN
jgi:hypothetical protein